MAKSWKQHVSDLSGATIASGAATALDAIIYAVLMWTVVDATALTVGVAAGIGALFGGGVHYVLSRFWVFERFDAPVKRSALGYFAMSWLAAGFHGTITQLLVVSIGPSAGWMLSKALVWVLWTYPLSRYVIFGGVGASSADRTNETANETVN